MNELESEKKKIVLIKTIIPRVVERTKNLIALIFITFLFHVLFLLFPLQFKFIVKCFLWTYFLALILIDAA